MSSYTDRRRETTERALAMSDPDSALARVWADDPDLAIDMAEVVNHVPTVRQALTSGVFRLQLRAVTSTVLPLLDPDLLVDLPMDVRRALSRRIRNRRLTALADALIESVHANWGAEEAGRLLAVCSRGVVELWLPVLEHAVDSLSPIAKRHPDYFLTKASRELAPLAAFARDDWWRRYGTSINEVVAHDPAKVLELVEQFGPSTWLPVTSDRTAPLASVDAGRFIRLLENRSYRLSRATLATLVNAGPAELVQLGRKELLPVLRALPPSRRAAFFDEVNADKDMSRADVAEEVLRLLPHARRAEEALRLRAIAAETGAEQKVRRMTAFLPFDSAKDELTKVTLSGEATERAEGYPLLIACAARDFRLAELLPWLADRLQREQDPVRLAALQGLAAANPNAFPDAPELARIAADAFDARDFSYATGQTIAALCVKLLVHNRSRVALDILADYWARTSWSTLGGLGVRLRHGQEHEVFQVLRPAVTAAAKRADFTPALALAHAFDRRTWHMPDLLEPLWSAVTAGSESQSRQAINVLLADPRNRNARVQRILDLERSAVYVHSVLSVLQHSRTDLLDRLFARRVPTGKFAPGKVRRLPLFLASSSWRWLPAQRVKYAELLMQLVDDDDQSRAVRAAAVRTLGSIHGPAKTEVRRYLSASDELIAQAAITALPDSDDPVAALRLLLDRALSDNRGHAELASMYTVRRCARRVAPSLLASMLVVDGGRVTVRKELVRLVSDFRLPGAVEILHRTWSLPNQHRDVRAACAFAALSWLDDPAAWELLRSAVNGPREIAMQTLRATPWAVPPAHRTAVAELIHSVAVGPDDRLRREALSALGNWTTAYPAAVTVLSSAITDLDERSAWTAAASGLTRLVTSPAGEAAVISTLHTLLSSEDPDALADRDRPALQRARTVTQHLCFMWNRTPPMRDIARRVARELERYDEFRPEVVRLHLSTVRTKAPEAVDDLREVEHLTADRPMLAAQAGSGLGQPSWEWNADFILAATQRLRDGHLRLSIVEVAGPALAWPEPWRNLLRELRRHPDPGVRDTALAITTAPE